MTDDRQIVVIKRCSLASMLVKSLFRVHVSGKLIPSRLAAASTIFSHVNIAASISPFNSAFVGFCGFEPLRVWPLT